MKQTRHDARSSRQAVSPRASRRGRIEATANWPYRHTLLRLHAQAGVAELKRHKEILGDRTVRRSPRASRRGRIEASQAVDGPALECDRSPRASRRGRIEAGPCCLGRRCGSRLHAQAGVAELKRAARSDRLGSPAGLHAQAGVAELKPRLFRNAKSAALRSPRASRRGRIEASSALISSSCSSGLHAQAGVAELKRRFLFAESILLEMSPRASRRGRIEAPRASSSRRRT